MSSSSSHGGFANITEDQEGKTEVMVKILARRWFLLVMARPREGGEKMCAYKVNREQRGPSSGESTCSMSRALKMRERERVKKEQ